MISHHPRAILRRRVVFGVVTAMILALVASEAPAQSRKGPPPTPPAGSAANPPPDPHEVREGGLHTGNAGFSTGPGGGLDEELVRNNPPPTPPLAKGLGNSSADPHDLSGSWYGDQFLPAFEIMTDMYGDRVPFNDVGRKVMDRRLLAHDKGKPYISPAILCRPSGPDSLMVRITTRFYQSKDRLDIFSTANHELWSIALNPSLLPPAKGKTYSGRSVGHWEGDTLVVENTDFKTRRWLSFRGTPISPGGKLIYHMRKLGDGEQRYLEIVTTVDDPTYYKRPWKFARSFTWRPDLALVDEFDCEEQVGTPSGSTDSGAVPEPDE
jgi:hypothetical protein